MLKRYQDEPRSIPSIIQTRGGCWTWGRGTDGGGYAVYYPGKRARRVSRLYYEMFNGPILHGLVIDHLCRNRICVNPAHLEAVTNRENILRGVGASAIAAQKTHCSEGHEFSPENTRMSKRGHRVCRLCARTFCTRNRRKNGAIPRAEYLAAPWGYR